MKPRVVDSQRVKTGVFLLLSFLVGVAFTLFWTDAASKQIISVSTSTSAPLEPSSIHRVHEVRSGVGSGLVQTAGAWGRQASAEAPPGLEERNISWEGPWVGRESLMAPTKTGLQHILFGIGSSSQNYQTRKELIKLWWRPDRTRGFVWLDSKVDGYDWQAEGLPEPQISGDTSSLPYSGGGPRSCLRIARIVVEAYRLKLPDVRWFVMGDDDTIFNPEVLAEILAQYDHTEMLYLGGNSETHGQMVINGFEMAYGGGGIAISWPLAHALSHTMDSCIERYPELWGSDARVHMCAAELGVQVTRVRGFHQCDLKGNVAGFLQAHPLAPFISMHHVLHWDPVFPNMTHMDALQRLTRGMHADPVNFLQTAFCVDQRKMLTVVVSWGYSVKLSVGAWRVGELERIETTFMSYHWRNWAEQFTFDTRPEVPVTGGQCGMPVDLWIDGIRPGPTSNTMESTYSRKVHANQTTCSPHVARISTVKVVREALPFVTSRDGLSKGPNLRRQCCQSLKFDSSGSTLSINLGSCNNVF